MNKSNTNKSNKVKCPDKIEFKSNKLIYKYFNVKSIYEKENERLLMITDGDIYYLLLISNTILDKSVYFTCHNKNKLLLEFQDYGISNTDNPFDEDSKKGKYYFIILKLNNIKSINIKSNSIKSNIKVNNIKSNTPITLQNAILDKKINLYSFKQLFKQLLLNYAKLNMKSGFKYNNFNMNSILLNDNMLVLYDYVNSTDNTKYKKIGKIREPKTIFFNKITDYSIRDKEIMSIQKSNYDIICILLLINFCERILNKYPNEISLNKEDKAIFNSTDELFEKLKYITKMDYFKTL
jgi:hypothetical protein